MKVTVNREPFFAAYQIAAAVAPSRSPKEILNNVKLQATEQGSVLTATDMDLGVRVALGELELHAAGAAVLPVAQIGPILRESSDDKLTIETTSQGAIVQGARSKWTLPTGEPAEFPDVPDFTATNFHKIQGRALRELIRRTVYAADVENARFALGGVKLELEADKIIAVGTDSRRLAKMEAVATTEGDFEPAENMTIVPTRSMQTLERMLIDDDDIHIAISNNDILVKTSRATLYSRLVEGRFPVWRDALPDRPNAHRFEVTVGPLHTALRQASIVTSQESRGIDFEFGGGVLILSGTTAEVGESRVELPIPYDGESIVLSLDHRYVTDYLKVLDPDKNTTVEIESNDGAALFSTDEGYRYVVMPMASRRKR